MQMMMTPMTRETIGDLIRRRRLEKGWTQAELGEKVGRSQRFISGLETGARTGARDAALAKLADALDIPHDELVIALGLVRTREAAIKLRRMSDEWNADQRARLEQAHAKLDAYLVKMDDETLAYLVDTAQLVTKRLDD